MSGFSQELPEDVDVETVTLIAYSDGRPTEVVMAGTLDNHVRHGVFNSIGSTLLTNFLGQLLTVGLKEVHDVDAW